MKILGKNIGLFVEQGGFYDTLGMSTNCAINITMDTIEKAASSSLAKAFRSGRYSYTLQVDRLYDGGSMMSSLLQCMVLGTPLKFTFTDGTAVGGELMMSDAGRLAISGEAIITGYAINAPVEGFGNASVSLQGVGPLSVDQDGADFDLGDAASVETGVIDLEDADSESTGIIDLGDAN